MGRPSDDQRVTLHRARELAGNGKEEILYLLDHGVKAQPVELSEVRKIHEAACRKLLALGGLSPLELARVCYCNHIPRALQNEAKRLLRRLESATALPA